MANTSLPDASTIPIPVKGFFLDELDGELLLFNPDSNDLLELNATAALVWQLCDGSRSTAALCELLRAAYPDEAAAIEADVPRILAHLRSLGALTWQ